MRMFFSDCCEQHSVLRVYVLLIVSNTVCEKIQCNDCEKGLFITRTCTETKDGIQGTQCEPCSKCDGEGQRILVNCTRVSNTRCGCEDGYVQTSNSNCEKEMTPPSPIVTPRMKQHSICMMAAVPVFIAVFFIALAVSVLFTCVSFKPGGKLLMNSAKPDII